MLERLALIADIRGDSPEAALFRRGAAVVRGHPIDSDVGLGPLLSLPPGDRADLDSEVYRRLHHMYEAGAWVLMKSAIADLPVDLRWLLESGAVTIEQLAALHSRLDVTT